MLMQRVSMAPWLGVIGGIGAFKNLRGEKVLSLERNVRRIRF